MPAATVPAGRRNTAGRPVHGRLPGLRTRVLHSGALERFSFEKGETRGVRRRPARRERKSRAFSAKPQAVWFERRSISNWKCADSRHSASMQGGSPVLSGRGAFFFAFLPGRFHAVEYASCKKEDAARADVFLRMRSAPRLRRPAVCPCRPHGPDGQDAVFSFRETTGRMV